MDSSSLYYKVKPYLKKTKTKHPKKQALRKKKKVGQAPMDHVCNLSYSEGRDQEDCSLKPTQANSS
jgi:hypothetical protein